ncbi:hypothetical protein CI102_7916 [Trichoderma harzianum]|nr:hypothetical protein CI102_7916 [Trichoderma harzianum]
MYGLGTFCGKYKYRRDEVRAFPCAALRCAVLCCAVGWSSASAALHHWKSLITQAQSESDPALSKSPGQPEQLPARATSPPTLPRHIIKILSRSLCQSTASVIATHALRRTCHSPSARLSRIDPPLPAWHDSS